MIRGLGRDPALLILVGAGAVFAALSPRFLEPANLVNIVVQCASVGIVATGMTFVLLTAGIDLSVGAIMFVSAAVAGKMAVAGSSLPVVFTVILAIGALCGVPAGAPLQRLCCTIVRDGIPVASLILYRPHSGRPFSSDERSAVKAAGRYLSLNAGAAAVDTNPATYRAGGEDALLLCERDGRIAKASGNGYSLLAQAAGCPNNRKTVPEELERSGREFVRRLLAEPELLKGRDARGPSRAAALINAWGMFRLRVFFESDGPLGVLIERVDHLLVRLCEAMWRLDLSVQQCEALLLLAQGLNHESIAERMGIARNTVVYHIRQLYSKLGAHTRDEAIASVLSAGEANVTV